MTTYYVETTTAVAELLKAVLLYHEKPDPAELPEPPKAYFMLAHNWLTAILTEVDAKSGGSGHVSFDAAIQAVKDKKLALKVSQQGIRARRLGLRISGINPRGPYGLPAFEKRSTGAAKPVKAYQEAVEDLGVRCAAIINAIKGGYPAKKSYIEDLRDALRRLVAQYGSLVTGRQNHLDRLLADMEQYLIDFGTKATEPEVALMSMVPPNSSYWASSFIASSSSSSTMPPP